MRWRATAALLLSGTLVLGACGGDDDDDAASDAADTTAATEESAEETEESPDESEAPATSEEDEEAELPDTELFDPCVLLSAEEIEAITGSNPGASEVQAAVPDQRKVCFFDNGLILAIEVGENYEPSVALIRYNSEGSTITDVEGVGEAAIWQDYGNGIGQFVALGSNGLFVGVSVPAGGQEVGQALAEEMLARL
jgi:hypothetical protein